MAVKGILFDVDGTLLDTNPDHLRAWHRTLLERGFEVSLERIAPELGKGGDKLVPSLLGEEVERELGEAIRAAQKERFLEVASRIRFELFPGVLELLAELRRRGVRTALVTSSSSEHFAVILERAGVDLRGEVDEVVTGSDAAQTKPAPDLVQAGLGKLGLAPGEALMVGDTPHDGEAARRAGVGFVGLLSGGSARAALEEVGARVVLRDPRELHERLEQVLGSS